MVATWIKFLKKEPKEKSQKIFDIVWDIINWNTRHLDIKPMNWQKNIYRCRVWDIRIVYENNNWNVLIRTIWYRWDIYK